MTEAQMIQTMTRLGYSPETPDFWNDVSQQFRKCYVYGELVYIDEQSQNICDRRGEGA